MFVARYDPALVYISGGRCPSIFHPKPNAKRGPVFARADPHHLEIAGAHRAWHLSPAMAQVLSAQSEMEGKLESIIISRWLKQVREARNQNGNSADSTWLDFMFSSATPHPIHLECEISNRENGPQQPGWFPPFWLHYLHAVAMN